MESHSRYLRLVFDHSITDSLGSSTRRVLAHAYPGVTMLSVEDVRELEDDSLGSAHERWIIAPRIHSSAIAVCQQQGIRIVAIDDVFLAKDTYARYCDAYINWWERERAKNLFGPVIDLDFRLNGQSARNASILSWLVESLRVSDRYPSLLIGEFGTGKTITVRQLVADICEAYRRRASDLRAIYVNLNALDIRAGRTEFVERSLMDLALSRDDVYELVKLLTLA